MHKPNFSGTINAEAVTKGLSDAAQAFKNTLTTISKDGLSVTITAEPKIVDVQIDKTVDIDKLGFIFKDCLNEAFIESGNKIIKLATKELEGIK